MGYNNADTNVFATSFTVSENLPLTAIRSVGFNGAIATTASAPIDGTFSVSWVPSEGKIDGTQCEGRGGAALTGKIMIAAPKKLFTADPIWFSVAEEVIFKKGAATSFSLSIEPNNLITCTLDGNFYDKGGMLPGAGALAGGAEDETQGAAAVAHGSTSGLDNTETADLDIGFSTAPFNMSYSATRGLNPIYTVNNFEAAFIMPTDPQESMTMQGDNLPRSVYNLADATKYLCTDPVQLSFNVKSVCDKEIFSTDDLNVCGYVQSRDVNIATDDVLRGNITVIDYNYPQEGGGGG